MVQINLARQKILSLKDSDLVEAFVRLGQIPDLVPRSEESMRSFHVSAIDRRMTYDFFGRVLLILFHDSSSISGSTGSLPNFHLRYSSVLAGYREMLARTQLKSWTTNMSTKAFPRQQSGSF